MDFTTILWTLGIVYHLFVLWPNMIRTRRRLRILTQEVRSINQTPGLAATANTDPEQDILAAQQGLLTAQNGLLVGQQALLTVQQAIQNTYAAVAKAQASLEAALDRAATAEQAPLDAVQAGDMVIMEHNLQPNAALGERPVAR